MARCFTFKLQASRVIQAHPGSRSDDIFPILCATIVIFDWDTFINGVWVSDTLAKSNFTHTVKVPRKISSYSCDLRG
ncbi:hypothetical protein HYPSUDRAFT_39501 [Hypholoma sublateritium FD-334 SS-4]|uniref:Uncharacterized protein n=1 Tax=Hypholoma sublateritium (strain FD-334 SS-4) TaxID=945553 RepID=A0A0D2PWX1_HYPSF|nr:hypothetical protein HYPSUDRAFT_39501 [Hypholoma sublateritium FD-334 SS-4]